MSTLKIVHFSPTPLVGAPSKIVKTLNEAGFQAYWIIGSDYPNKGALFQKFSSNAFNLKDISIIEKNCLESFISEANIIHIHNDISKEISKWFYELNPAAKYIYQVHSPLREGPLYMDRSNDLGLPISKKLVVAQYQPRHYQEFTIVPNLVLNEPSVNLRKDGEKLRIMFSPTHARGGRWNSKYSEKLIKVLKAYEDLNFIELINIDKPVSPDILMELRKTCHVSIDEIVTGAYHQVSLEGLCAGNVVLNFADYFSCAMLKQISGSTDFPPFIRTSEKNLESVLAKLIFDEQYCRDIQILSFNYFKEYLMADKLINQFVKVYNA